jgi:hypothetical protein
MRNRADHVARLHALIDDLLDEADEDNPEGYDIGIIAVVVEVVRNEELADLAGKRRLADYEPRTDTYFDFRCSETRRLFQAAMFRWLARYAQAIVDEPWKRSIEKWWDAQEADDDSDDYADLDDDDGGGDRDEDDGEEAEEDPTREEGRGSE